MAQQPQQPRRRDPKQSSQAGGAPRRRVSGSGAAKRGNGGMFLLFICAIIACAGAAFVLYPEKIQSLLNQITGQQTANNQDKQPELQKDTNDQTTTQQPVAKQPVSKQPKKVADTIVEDKQPVADKQPQPPTAPVEKRHFPQDEEALSVLKKADQSYTSLNWGETRSLANQALGMDASPEIKAKTKQLIQTASDIQDFMAHMTSDQYGMTRGIYTTGAVAQITYSSSKTENVIPIKDMNSNTPATDGDPVAYIQAHLNAGEAFVMNEKNIAAMIKPTQVISVDPADMESANAEHLAETKSKFKKVKDNPLLANDPIALYEVARYAYLVGVDKPVTALLERALAIDPELATSVRNDRANESYEKMVRSMKKGSTNTAAAHLRTIKNHYEDTYIYKEALAYYQGENAKLAQIQKDERQRKQKTRQDARDKARAAAVASNDTEKIQEIEEIEQNEKEESHAVASGDEGKADALWAKGQDYLSQALADGADRAGKKDALLGKAFHTIMDAKNIYIKLAEAGNTNVMNKLVQCGQDAYTAKKSMRP